jgi:hypothetical protein
MPCGFLRTGSVWKEKNLKEKKNAQKLLLASEKNLIFSNTF